MSACIHVLIGVVAPVVEGHAQQETVLEPADVALVVDAAEYAIVLILVVEPLEDRVHQVAVDAEHPELDGGAGRDPHRRLVGDAQGVDVALPVIDHVDSCSRRRRCERDILGHASGNALPDLVGVDVEPRFDIGRQLVCQVRACPRGFAPAVLAEAVLLLPRAGDEVVDGAGRTA